MASKPRFGIRPPKGAIATFGILAPFRRAGRPAISLSVYPGSGHINPGYMTGPEDARLILANWVFNKAWPVLEARIEAIGLRPGDPRIIAGGKPRTLVRGG